MLKKLTKIMLTALLSLSVLAVNTEIVKAENSGFAKPEFIELLDQIIESETKYGLSGVQLAVYKDGNLIKNNAYGHTNNYYNVYEDGVSVLKEAKALPLDERNAVTTDTLFDMASNTKMYATVFAMQKLAGEGHFTLDTLIKDIYPEFTEFGNEKGEKDIITIKHVLNHSAGFAPDPQYHNNNYDKNTGSETGINHLYSQDKEKTLEMIMKTSIDTPPGTKWAYSDVDMMLAGFIVEKYSGKDLDTYVKENFYTPLGLDRITFNPLRFGFVENDTSSSELHGNTRDGRIDFNNVRTEIVTGEVHDEKAFYSMDGVSGHAGLFGTAQQVAYLAQAMFDGTLDSQTFFDEETLKAFTATSDINATQTNGGWRRKSETGGAAGWFSKFAPAGTIGHTGWTGTNTMIDKDNKLTLALFTNARNTPIMGPEANDFYTKNSNISSYGAVSEFVYRALGFGTETAHEVLESMVLGEIPADIAGSQSAKRNVVRSLIDVVELRAETDAEAKALFEDTRIQNTIKELEKYEAKDLKFLTVTKNFEAALEEAKNLDTRSYTKESVKTYEDAVTEIEAILAGEYTQEDIDQAILDLETAKDLLEVFVESVDKSQLKVLLDKASTYKAEDYTPESFAALTKAIDEAKAIYTDADATQDDVDAVEEKLEQAMAGLKEKVKEETEKPDEKEEEVKKPTTPTTGIEQSSIIIPVVIIIAALAAVFFLRKKKDK